MSKSEFTAPVVRPEWLDDSLVSLKRTCEMALDGTFPEIIKGWMISTACMRTLRAIYGSDLDMVAALRTRVLESEGRMQLFDMFPHEEAMRRLRADLGLEESNGS